MPSARRIPVDQPVRDRLVSEFDSNFLVEAGAGSGKTFSLAARMAAGIAAGVYTVERLTVVTFTRKAAAELRGRLQMALEERLRHESPGEEPNGAERQRLEAALAGMERLVSGTIHSFCGRLLREHPVDAAVAPGFDELSDVGNLRRQRQAWRDFVSAAIAGGSKPMLDLLEAGVRPKDLYDAFATLCEHEDVEFDEGAGDPPDPEPVWREVDRFWKKLRSLRPDTFHDATTCPVQKRFDEYEGRLRLARRDRLSSLASFFEAWGKPAVTQKYWGEEVGRPRVIGKEVKTLVDAFYSEVIQPFDVQWKAYVHRLSMKALVEAREFYAQERRRQNAVNYVDLLRVTARMLRERHDVRHALQQRYPYLLVDEFQDTDPIQAEIFLMLAADERGPAQAIDPFKLPLRPGALFVVGDPKQSIFRFRRADIDIYNRVARRIRETGGEVVTLSANFRSLPGVCDVANTVFPPLFASHGMPYSPVFTPLDPVRGETEAAGEVRVATITIPDGGRGSRPEEEEARQIAVYIDREVARGRRNYGDFLVLARQRPRLRTYLDAFDVLEIPVDVSGAGLFCGSEEVKALAGLLGALADPLDSVALTGVLRGPLFGHADPELFQFRQAGGRIELSMPLPSPGNDTDTASIDARYGPVAGTLRRLQEMWRATRVLPAGAAVERILEDTGWLALAATTPGGAGAGHLLQAIDRVREVVGEGGGLIDAAEALAEEEISSEAEALPLEPGRQNVVRLMNLHRAKGLEADVVLLADATHAFQFPVHVRIVRPDGEGGVARGYLRIMRPAESRKKGPIGQPADWASHEQEEQKYRDAERLRLLYVAGTRARDVLVVCRSESSSKNKAWDVFEEYLERVPELAIPEVQPVPQAGQVKLTAQVIETARLARDARLEASRRRSWAVTSVTGAVSGTSAGPAGSTGQRALEAAVEVPDGPLQRADAGAIWGTFVHGLLEHAMRHQEATRSDLERLARWLTVEQPDLRAVIPVALDLVQAASGAPFWKEARKGGEIHAETPFAIRQDAKTGVPGAEPVETPTILRGVIDLVHRSGDGWRILDYKTAGAGIDQAALLERHRRQLEQYRHAWEQATGEKVASVALVPLEAPKR